MNNRVWLCSAVLGLVALLICVGVIFAAEPPIAARSRPFGLLPRALPPLSTVMRLRGGCSSESGEGTSKQAEDEKEKQQKKEKAWRKKEKRDKKEMEKKASQGGAEESQGSQDEANGHKETAKKPAKKKDKKKGKERGKEPSDEASDNSAAEKQGRRKAGSNAVVYCNACGIPPEYCAFVDCPSWKSACSKSNTNAHSESKSNAPSHATSAATELEEAEASAHDALAKLSVSSSADAAAAGAAGVSGAETANVEGAGEEDRGKQAGKGNREARKAEDKAKVCVYIDSVCARGGEGGWGGERVVGVVIVYVSIFLLICSSAACFG